MEKILLIQIESGGNLKMDTSSLKNIVVLKDLPSNIVEEAIVVLKENQKIQSQIPVLRFHDFQPHG